MEKEYDLLVFVGRMQPFHNEHKRIIDIALEKSKHVLVLIGSAGAARTARNPFTYEERKFMIEGAYPSRYYGNGNGEIWPNLGKIDPLIIRPLYDTTYNDAAWIKQVQDIVTEEGLRIVNDGGFQNHGIADCKIGLIGASKDHTSYYLKFFPQWGNIGVEVINDTHATTIRDHLYSYDISPELFDVCVKDSVPASVAKFLFNDFSFCMPWAGTEDHPPQGFIHTSYYTQLKEENAFILEYKRSWAKAPYPVKHVTVDCVVEQSGHILLVRRRSKPGKGLWALPGGHLNEYERLIDGAIRELKEETKIKVPEAVLRGSIVSSRAFDDPYRSTIGRIITHAYHIKLTDDVKLPKVKGSDDADKAVWVPIASLKENELFDDHHFIIKEMVGF